MKNARIATFFYIFTLAALSACGGSNNTASSSSPSSLSQSSSSSQAIEHSIETTISGSGTLTPSQAVVQNGESLLIEILPAEGYVLDEVSGCHGSYNDGTFSIDSASESCTLTAIFEPIAITVEVNTNGPGQYHASQETLAYGDSLTLELTPDAGYYPEAVTGCSGEIDENTYVIDRLASDCSIDIVFTILPPLPDSPDIWFDYNQEKTIRFYWTQVEDAEEFQLFERLDEGDAYELVATIDTDIQTYDHRVFLLTHTNASYKLRACNVAGCSESNTASSSENILEVAGSWKRNIEEVDPSAFTIDESGGIMLISSQSPYAAHVYIKEGNQWLYTQELTGSARNQVNRDSFGQDIAVATEGKVIAVGAPCHADVTASNENDSQENSDRPTCSGAVYIYRYKNGVWEEEAYLKPTPLETHSFFGTKISLSEDGKTLAVLSWAEKILPDDSIVNGAIHLYQYENGAWIETDTLSPSCSLTGNTINFGKLVIADNGKIIALSAPVSFQLDITPLPEGYPDELLENPCYRGFVYVFQNDGESWDETRTKPSDGQLEFGNNFSISGDGTIFSSSGLRPDNFYVYENINDTWKNVFIKAGKTKGIVDSTGKKLVIVENQRISQQKKQVASVYIKKTGEWSTLIPKLILNDGDSHSLVDMKFSEDGEALHIMNRLHNEDAHIMLTY